MRRPAREARLVCWGRRTFLAGTAGTFAATWTAAAAASAEPDLPEMQVTVSSDSSRQVLVLGAGLSKMNPFLGRNLKRY